MAEIAGSFLGPAIEAVKWVGAPIIRQFNYLCCFTSNITSLKHEAEKLDATTGDLQGQVDRARDNVRVIAREVETWLTTSKDIKDEMNGILNEVPNVESGCLKLRAHFSLSKRAKKTSDRMKELRGQCKFDAISQPRPPAAMGAAPLGRTHEFESRKQIEEDIMTTLRGGDVNMIGICGMGGLGKTTMSKRIMNRALEEHVFQEVVMAVVSQQADKLKIQLEIGGSLGLDLKDETSHATRVQNLHVRLSGTKRILLVLDDVWERLVLEDLGIPCGSKGCTILLTSRNSDVLSAMNVQKVFGMEILSEEEAWFLFRERVGTYVDDTKLNSLAKQVVKECSGLPIALTTVGAALKDEKNVPIWKDAVRQLRQCDPDIPDFIAKVYNPLKLSYDVLDSKHAKSVFLLCCLFREDADICLEYLTCFCMGLGIFEGGIRNLEEARNRMCALTKMLKSRSLLLDGRNEDYVRMHDVVRDVCIFIAKQEGYIGHQDCTWISSFQTVGERTKLPTNLRLLFLTGNSELEEQMKLDSTFFEGIHVLFIENYSLTSLLRTTQSLKNLNTLILISCEELETISVVGEFVNLEILICRHCYRIKELPPEIKGLNRLKLLELTWCRELQRIGRGIISSLVGLEELKMLRSFKNWETWDSKERENAGLRELEALTNLRCLEIQIKDPALAAENMRLSSKLERFHISINTRLLNEFVAHSSNKILSLELEGETCLGDWIEMQLLRDAEYLHLTGNGVNNVDLAKSQNIRWLWLYECETMKTMKNIVRTSMNDDGGATVFPPIENLLLYSLPGLEEILDVTIFTNLYDLRIYCCPRLRNLGQLSVAGKDCLSQLEVLHIKECEMMERVFLWNEEGQNKNNSESRITKMFPKLKEVELDDLPNLATFCQGIEGIEFPLLTKMQIDKCPKMTSIISAAFLIGIGSNQNSGGTSNAGIDDDLFCQPSKVSFGSLRDLSIQAGENLFRRHKIPVSSFNGLEKLVISGYKGSMSLFMSSIARNLVSLRELYIWDCNEMVKVIEDEEEEEAVSGGERTLLFPKLEELFLKDLNKLVSFCEWNCDVNCRRVDIEGCSNMKIFNLGSKVSFSFNGLEELLISGYEGTMSLFSPSIVGNLVSLKELSILKCDEMVKVIEDEEEEEKVVSGGGQRKTLLFPKLQKLTLCDLGKLVRFCEWKCDVELPSLRKLKIKRCPNMKICSLGSLAAPNLEYFKTDLNNYLEVGVNVLFDSLKQLTIKRNENPFYCYKIHVSLFNGLEKLTVYKYKGSMSLFSPSIAGNLVSLKELSIENCDEMVKVIEDKEEEEEALSGGERTLVFPKLQELHLLYLLKLVSFCECDVELPSLSQVAIQGCPDMKIFTLESLAAPNLKYVDINYKDFDDLKDLNGELQQQYLAREKKKQQEEKKGGAEDQERKGEIEEENSSTISSGDM